jgi:hypothetical protein
MAQHDILEPKMTLTLKPNQNFNFNFRKDEVKSYFNTVTYVIELIPFIFVDFLTDALFRTLKATKYDHHILNVPFTKDNYVKILVIIRLMLLVRLKVN